MLPFLKWAGGKRWLIAQPEFTLPSFEGRYFEPFVGGGAMFFANRPQRAILSDANASLIETYVALRDDWKTVVRLLGKHHKNHSSHYYYEQRDRRPGTLAGRAALFIYLNRACWNGLYRVNKSGKFNVPIGTKNWVLSDDDDFRSVSDALSKARLIACDFEDSINLAGPGDLIFADPPYTVAHNHNGFVKYNDSIFTWGDQVRLRDCLARAVSRGSVAVVTNADHLSIRELYSDVGVVSTLSRQSVISGNAKGRRTTTEVLVRLGRSELETAT